eukprot:ANDGO_08312.mRNA.1 hypothetical protein
MTIPQFLAPRTPRQDPPVDPATENVPFGSVSKEDTQYLWMDWKNVLFHPWRTLEDCDVVLEDFVDGIRTKSSRMFLYAPMAFYFAIFFLHVSPMIYIIAIAVSIVRTVLVFGQRKIYQLRKIDPRRTTATGARILASRNLSPREISYNIPSPETEVNLDSVARHNPVSSPLSYFYKLIKNGKKDSDSRGYRTVCDKCYELALWDPSRSSLIWICFSSPVHVCIMAVLAGSEVDSMWKFLFVCMLLALSLFFYFVCLSFTEMANDMQIVHKEAVVCEREAGQSILAAASPRNSSSSLPMRAYPGVDGVTRRLPFTPLLQTPPS